MQVFRDSTPKNLSRPTAATAHRPPPVLVSPATGQSPKPKFASIQPLLRAGAPPVYRPQIQAKPAAAPPVYRPQIQAKPPAAPPVYRPVAVSAAQAKPSGNAPLNVHLRPAFSPAQRNVIQRQVPVGEQPEVRNYFNLRVAEIGNPAMKRHRDKLAEILLNANDKEDAKQRIRDYVAAWHHDVDQEAAEPPRAGPIGRTPSTEGASSFLKSLYPSEITGPVPRFQNEMAKSGYTVGQFLTLSYESRRKVLSIFTGPSTLYEQNLLQQPSGEEVSVYRYHKFRKDAISMHLVTGGGLNKKEISHGSADKLKGGMKQSANVRSKQLEKLSTTQGPARRKLLEDFQASAMETPFIATTSDSDYAFRLFDEYPPQESQIAVVLEIRGPRNRLFDFEREFQALGGAGGGQAQWNWRGAANRAKDRDQREFGISDLFIPMLGVSESGFRVVRVIRLG